MTDRIPAYVKPPLSAMQRQDLEIFVEEYHDRILAVMNWLSEHGAPLDYDFEGNEFAGVQVVFDPCGKNPCSLSLPLVLRSPDIALHDLKRHFSGRDIQIDSWDEAIATARGESDGR